MAQPINFTEVDRHGVKIRIDFCPEEYKMTIKRGDKSFTDFLEGIGKNLEDAHSALVFTQEEAKNHPLMKLLNIIKSAEKAKDN